MNVLEFLLALEEHRIAGPWRCGGKVVVRFQPGKEPLWLLDAMRELKPQLLPICRTPRQDGVVLMDLDGGSV